MDIKNKMRTFALHKTKSNMKNRKGCGCRKTA